MQRRRPYSDISKYVFVPNVVVSRASRPHGGKSYNFRLLFLDSIEHCSKACSEPFCGAVVCFECSFDGFQVMEECVCSSKQL